MNKSLIVHLFHILIVGGLFLYVGINQTKIFNFIYTVLIVLSIVIFIYHGYKVYLKCKEGKSYLINLFHMGVVAPLLLYIGLNGDKTKRFYFELLLMLGFTVIGYHGYYMIKGE